MQDKEMIEEMAKDIEEHIVFGWRKELYIGSAEEMYNLGYRKISKDSVVFTKEELEEKYEPSEKFMSVARELEDLKQNLEDNVVLSREEAERFRGQTINLKKVKAQSSKETAEKIFNDIFALINNAKDKSYKIFGNSSDYGKGYKNSVNHFNKHILELAKQFGVEIKE